MADDIASMVEKIMGNPEFREMVKELRGEDAPPDGDLMRRLPEVMGALSPILGSVGSRKEVPPGDGNGAGGETEAAPSPVVRGGRFNRKNAERLLAALRPYLSDSRCGIIDKCVSVMQITELIDASGAFGNLLPGSAGGDGA